MSHEKIATKFDQWAKSGRGEGMEQGHGDVVRQVIAQMGLSLGQQTLDLGCGIGWATRLLAKAAPGTGAVGVDVAPEMIAKAEELHSYTIRAKYEVARFEELPFDDESFDRVFSMEAIYYSPDLDRALSEAQRVLRPGGTIDLVLDCYDERESTRAWSEQVGLAMHCLPEAEWPERLESAGFASARTERVIDSRGQGDRESFEPGPHWPDWDTLLAYHSAGSLWVHGEK